MAGVAAPLRAHAEQDDERPKQGTVRLVYFAIMGAEPHWHLMRADARIEGDAKPPARSRRKDVPHSVALDKEDTHSMNRELLASHRACNPISTRETTRSHPAPRSG